MQIADLNFLVAEDHDFQRRTLVRMLAGLGAKNIADAADGRAALEIFRDPGRRIDIIISDLEMPGMDGMEFIRHVGAAGVPVSVILSSALDPALVSSVETMTKAYGITLLGAIEKPVTPQKLEGLIRKYAPPKPKAAKPAGAGPLPLEEIRQGLKNGEFVPFFQPKVSLSDGTVTGAEALARWLHPQKGIIAPYAFIGPLEEHGLIDNLTWTMLEKSAKLCRDWTSNGLEVTVSVNLSLKSLTDPGLAERVTEIVQGQGLEPRRMVLEVTESAAMTDVGRALENLARLRMKGFGLSIDDYGTGYSSMQQLSRIPFTELKIDQSFVLNAIEKESSKVILASSLDMAKKLKLKAVAEGVETRAHWNQLKSLNCDIAQGYFIAKPMDTRTFSEWVLAWTPPE
ncbi:MAG TPA: EAL domain-containing response regulator [Burkholderiales bacterium]|nr:EAL domain-containing response regulator [Burkholderiales bacterium]